MDLKDLMAISGYPGLYRFISQGRNAIIVESLEDRKRMSAYSTSRISTLEEIAVFTETGEMPLADVFRKMYEKSGGSQVLSHKSPDNEIKGYFDDVLPEYDREKVYVSDMKKIIHWYNLLIKFDMIGPEEVKEESAGDKGTGKHEDAAGHTGSDKGEDTSGTKESGGEGPAADKGGSEETGTRTTGKKKGGG